MRQCQGEGMCKYACGAKFELLREKDKYKIVSSKYKHFVKTYKTQADHLAKLNKAGDKNNYQSYKKETERTKQQYVKLQN